MTLAIPYPCDLSDAIADMRADADEIFAIAEGLAERGKYHIAQVLRNHAAQMRADANEIEMRNERIKRTVT